MLTLRKAQMDIFEQHALARFEKTLREHTQAELPTRSQTIGEQGLTVAIHQTLTHANSLGFTTKGSIHCFFQMTLRHGSGFASDPQYFDAPTKLKEGADEMDRIDALLAYIQAYEYSVFGNDNQHQIAAINAIIKKLEEVKWLPVYSAEADNSDTIIDLGLACFPQRQRFTTLCELNKLFDLSHQFAKQLGLQETRVESIFTLLMFALGHHCLKDPLYPPLCKMMQALQKTQSRSSLTATTKAIATTACQVLAQVNNYMETEVNNHA